MYGTAPRSMASCIIQNSTIILHYIHDIETSSETAAQTSELISSRRLIK